MKKPFIRRVTKKILILANVLSGLLFLGGAHAADLNPEEFWLLSLLPLALPYLLLALIIFFVFWIFIKPLWSLISVIFIVFGFHAVQHIIPLRLGSSFQMVQAPGTIRVMSWNVELLNINNREKRPDGKAHMLQLINRYNPDIACLQEVVAGEDTNAINYLPDILEQLQFKDYFYAYNLRNDFDSHHHFGILILSKYPIVKKQSMINTPDDYNSTFQFTDVLIGSDTVRVFNVHLQSLKFSEENMEYIDEGKVHTDVPAESKSVLAKLKTGVLKRAVQARFVKDEMNHTPYPIILCGDFNDVPASYAYATIGENMQNAFVEKGSGISRTYSGISPTLRIDNIFVDSNFRVMQFKRIRKPISDHFPIIADIRLK